MMITQDTTTHEPSCLPRWAACWWCHTVLCKECSGTPIQDLCRIHAPFARRRYDLSAEIDAFNDYIGDVPTFKISEKVPVSPRLIGYGAHHECFVQDAYYRDFTDEVCITIKTKYGIHREFWALTPRYWAMLLKRVGIARIPKKGNITHEL